jgi:hypothetical protein
MDLAGEGFAISPVGHALAYDIDLAVDFINSILLYLQVNILKLGVA